ncbi:MAG: PqqD family protein [Actinomycetes bacterium]
MAKASAVIKQSPEVISRAGPFGVVILAPRDLEPRLLEGSARLVWDLLSDWSTTQNIAESLAELFGADHGVVSRDVEMVINELIATEAVVVS